MTTSVHISRCRTTSVSPPSGLSFILTMARVWAERRALANMGESRLRDIGVSLQDAKQEAARPFWDLPDTRA